VLKENMMNNVIRGVEGDHRRGGDAKSRI